MTCMQIVDFLLKYWPFISIGVVVILDIIIIIVKKRPKTYDDFVHIIEKCIAWIPFYIVEAEAHTDLSGPQKKELALQHLLSFAEARLGHELNDDQLDYFFKTISVYIEKVLACPTKKGGLGREEDVG